MRDVVRFNVVFGLISGHFGSFRADFALFFALTSGSRWLRRLRRLPSLWLICSWIILSPRTDRQPWVLRIAHDLAASFVTPSLKTGVIWVDLAEMSGHSM